MIVALSDAGKFLVTLRALYTPTFASSTTISHDTTITTIVNTALNSITTTHTYQHGPPVVDTLKGLPQQPLDASTTSPSATEEEAEASESGSAYFAEQGEAPAAATGETSLKVYREKLQQLRLFCSCNVLFSDMHERQVRSHQASFFF